LVQALAEKRRGYRAYDSCPLDAGLAAVGVERGSRT
jgi:hypothetical protein